MILDVLPFRTDAAAANMAADFLLLQQYPAEQHARFRAYGWHRPAASFGFSQKIAQVRAALAPEAFSELVRRPTGGGIVDHRDDWTYALVLPRHHRLAQARAVDSYRAVHAALAEALGELGVPATLQTRCASDGPCSSGELPGVCFQRAELFDVVQPTTGAKIAGAAQKRTKRGLLIQGSIWRPHVAALDWTAWPERFIERLAALLDGTPTTTGWPDFDEAHSVLTENYSAPEWMEHR